MRNDSPSRGDTDRTPRLRDPETDPDVQRVEEPGKIVRMATMMGKLLEELRRSPLDEPARDRLAEVHEAAVDEVTSGLSENLDTELARVRPSLHGRTPSQPELRIAQAQLMGWLEGLLQGMQAAVAAGQIEAAGLEGVPPPPPRPGQGGPETSGYL